MTKRVAILQSNYVPWKGTFDLIGSVDEFVLYDDVQFTKNDWRNRNRIKTEQGLRWLTIPVRGGGRFGQRILDVEIADERWGVRHWKTLNQSYARAPHFERYREVLAELYLGSRETSLSLVNHAFLTRLCEMLGIHTRISWSHDHPMVAGRVERLIDLCQRLGASEYLSGPAAKSYLDPVDFERAGISVRWMDYSDYPEYPQIYPPFVHEVSVLDLLFNTGPDAPRYMRCFSQETPR